MGARPPVSTTEPRSKKKRQPVLLVGPGASELPAPLFPMHRREALARGERSRTDTMHIIVTSVNSLIILLAMGFGSTAFGKPFASTQSGPSWYSSLPVV